MGKAGHTWVTLVAAVLLLAASSAGQYRADQVGLLGDLSRIRITGHTAFSAGAIRGALLGNDEYALASRPSASRRAFQGTLERLVRDGYLRAGFGRARVEVDFAGDPPRPEIRITEGPRFLAGELKITGLPERLEAEVRNRLTGSEKSATSADATAGRWQEGAPAPLDLAMRRNLLRATLDSLDRAGYFNGQARVFVRPAPTGNRAPLHVEVKELGQLTYLDSIEYTGRIRPGTRRVLPEFSGLRPGMAIRQGQIEEAERRLRASGRFLSTGFSLQTSEEGKEGPGRTSLTVHLIESDDSPELTLEPDADEKTLLALVRWWNALHQSDRDVVVSIQFDRSKPGARLRLVWSARHGMIARYFVGAGSKGESRSVAIALTAAGTVLTSNLSGDNRGIGVSPLPDFLPRFEVHTGPKSAKFPFRLRIDFGGGAEPWAPRSLAARIRVHPAAILALHSGRRRSDNGVLAIEKGSMRWRIDQATGVPIRLDFDLPETHWKIRLRTERGALTRMLAETCSDVTFLAPDPYESGDWAPAMAEFLLAQVLIPLYTQDRPTRELNARAASAVADVFRDILPACRRVAAGMGMGRDPAPPFVIPASRRPDRLPKPDVRATLPLTPSQIEMFAAVFPRMSWPSVTVREALRSFAGHTKGVLEEMSRAFANKETGPVGCLALAALFGIVDMPRGRSAAHEGLYRLGTEDFRRDYEMLLGLSGRSSPTGDLARAVVHSLCDLSGAEFEAIAELIGPVGERILRDCRKALRSAPSGADPDTTIRAALDRAWPTWLRPRVKVALEALRR